LLANVKQNSNRPSEVLFIFDDNTTLLYIPYEDDKNKPKPVPEADNFASEDFENYIRAKLLLPYGDKI